MNETNGVDISADSTVPAVGHPSFNRLASQKPSAGAHGAASAPAKSTLATKVMAAKRFSVAASFCAFIALLSLGMSACSNSTQPIGVALTPSSAQSIDQAQTVAITATVAQDAKNAGATWSVTGGGTLTGASTTAALYNAPATVASGFTATVTATSATDTTKLASLQIKVSAPPAVTAASLPAATAGAA